MQVAPIKPPLKGPEIHRLKLDCDRLLSNFAFKLDLRRYTEGETGEGEGARAVLLARLPELRRVALECKKPGVSRGGGGGGGGDDEEP